MHTRVREIRGRGLLVVLLHKPHSAQPSHSFFTDEGDVGFDRGDGDVDPQVELLAKELLLVEEEGRVNVLLHN